MPTPQVDDRTADQKAIDEALARDAMLDVPLRPSGVTPKPVEAFLRKQHKPVAVAGIVENGLVRPLDPTVQLAEQSKVIIVATGPI